MGCHFARMDLKAAIIRRISEATKMMLNDKKIKISTGQSRKSTFWKEQELWWSEFVLRLAKPERT